MLLVPSDVLNPRRADAHFADEAAAARAAGHTVRLIDHDALVNADARQAVSRLAADGATATYRGWMLTPAAYGNLETALTERGITLRTTAEQYQGGHELPGWYDALEKFTPQSTWTVGADPGAFDKARLDLGSGAGIVRDYTKSMKHYWAEAVFIPDLSDAPAAWSVAHRLLQLRDDDFAGGFVLRRFEHFTGAEVRTWWVHGVCRLITAHPDTPEQTPPDDFTMPDLHAAVASLGLPFVTIDLARRADGQWRVIELGDGQVSDRPATQPADSFLEAVLAA
jgi:hypothetical protein